MARVPTLALGSVLWMVQLELPIIVPPGGYQVTGSTPVMPPLDTQHNYRECRRDLYRLAVSVWPLVCLVRTSEAKTLGNGPWGCQREGEVPGVMSAPRWPTSLCKSAPNFPSKQCVAFDISRNKRVRKDHNSLPFPTTVSH